MKTRIAFNDGWEFIDGDHKETVRLPHTVEITAYNYCDENKYQKLVTYRKTLDVRQEWENKRIRLHFGGAAHKATVYVNGREAKEHKCGYTAFDSDITGLVKNDNNIIEVRLDSNENLNQPPFGNVIDYMTFGGLYRGVWLEVSDKDGIDDVYVYTKKIYHDVKKADLCVNVSGTGLQGKNLKFYFNNVLAAEKVYSADGLFELNLADVELWELNNPKLYEMRIEVYDNGRKIDEYVVKTGIRTAEWKSDGFYLNDAKIKLRGLNRHQSYPGIGYAAADSIQRLDADILHSELGVNAVRTSHYPQSQSFISRCDEIGLLVFTEIPGWQHIGDSAWKEIAMENVREMVKQYRNHPSIILWGVRINESSDDDDFYAKTNEICRSLDVSRATGGVRYLKNSHLLEDVYTYNDFSYDGKGNGIEKRSQVTKDTGHAYLVSEYNGHMFPTKSFDRESVRTEHALRHAKVLDSVAEADNVAGSFGWCMADYNTHKDFGSGDRICYHGVLDSFRNPKDAAFIYASQQDLRPVLFISSGFNIGEYPAGIIGDVYAYTNCDSVRMYKNDVLIADFDANHTPYKNMKHGPILIDDFIGSQIYENEGYSKKQADMVKKLIHDVSVYGMNRLPVSAKANAAKLMLMYHMTFEDGYRLYSKYYSQWGQSVTVFKFEGIKNGNVVKQVILEPVKSKKIVCQPSCTRLSENGTYEMALVRLAMTDQNGNILRFANDALHVYVKGDIELYGLKKINGLKDTDGSNVSGTIINLNGGTGGVFIRSTGKKGNGKLIIEGTDIESQVIDFTVDVN